MSDEHTGTIGTDAETDQALRPGTVELLGVLAYGELSAFDRMSADARHAPTLTGRVQLSQMAAAEMGHYTRLADHVQELGTPVEQAPQHGLPFHERIERSLSDLGAVRLVQTERGGHVLYQIRERPAVQCHHERLVSAATHPEPMVVVQRERQRFAVDVQRQRDQTDTGRITTGLRAVRVHQRGRVLVEKRGRVEADSIALESCSELNC
jgi:hypothetical protein